MSHWIRSLTMLFTVLLAGCSHQAHTQNESQNPNYGEDRYYSDAELDQMLAPIALYPDVVLSQVLMAATYPDEISEAAQWSYANPRLKGSAAVEAVERYEWDPSVKAMVAFPDLLQRLDQDIELTWQLGDAYIAQEGDVVASIQRLRDHAYRSKHLDSLDHLHAYRDNDVIIIEPVNPRLVYLPYYRPQVVYGNWWWPDYPPHYWDSPYGYNSGLTFYWGSGFALSTGFFYSGFHWHNHHIVTFDRHHYRPYQDRGHYYKHYRNTQRWHQPKRRHDFAGYRNDYRRDQHGGNRQFGKVYNGGNRDYPRQDQRRNDPRRDGHNSRDVQRGRDQNVNRDNYRRSEQYNRDNRATAREHRNFTRDRADAETHRANRENSAGRRVDIQRDRAHRETKRSGDERAPNVRFDNRPNNRPANTSRSVDNNSQDRRQATEQRLRQAQGQGQGQFERGRPKRESGRPQAVERQRPAPQAAGERVQRERNPRESIDNQRGQNQQEPRDRRQAYTHNRDSGQNTNNDYRNLNKSERMRAGGFQDRQAQQANPRANQRDGGQAFKHHGGGNRDGKQRGNAR